MRLAYFSPFPPQHSGVADYSLRLLEFLLPHAEIHLWTNQRTVLPRKLRKLAIKAIGDIHHLPHKLRSYDAVLYHMGNDWQFHRDIFFALCAVPGVVILHDYVLHHFFAFLLLDECHQSQRYVQEMEYNYGLVGCELAKEVLAGRRQPPWEANPLEYPLNKRILDCAEGIVVHSDFVLSRLSDRIQRPLQKIPHLDVRLLPVTSLTEAKNTLGIPPRTFVIGTFGFQTPSKRLVPILRAYAQFRTAVPDSLFLIVGEVSPVLSLEGVLAELGLRLNREVRLLGYMRKLEEFERYITACDVCVNLRYPTMGETSGSVLRALSHGRPTLVSNVGWFSELPDDCVAKVDTSEREEDEILEYLLHLYREVPLRRAMGENARAYVESHHDPERCAAAYCEFIQTVVVNRMEPILALTDAVGDELAQLNLSEDDPILEEMSQTIAAVACLESKLHTPTVSIEKNEVAEYLRHCALESLATTAQKRRVDEYLKFHFNRLLYTFDLVPPASREGCQLLDVGASPYFLTVLVSKFKNYQAQAIGFFGTYGQETPSGTVKDCVVNQKYGDRYEFEYPHVNVEHDAFPFPDGSFSVVLCTELIEHMIDGPIHLLTEINRVLELGGLLILSTPNVASSWHISTLLGQQNVYHPYIAFGPYARHNREYTVSELKRLLSVVGFSIRRVETADVYSTDVKRYPTEDRGNTIFVVARKRESARAIYPSWLFANPDRWPTYFSSVVVAGENDAQFDAGWQDAQQLEDACYQRCTSGHATVQLKAAGGETTVRLNVNAWPPEVASDSTWRLVLRDVEDGEFLLDAAFPLCRTSTWQEKTFELARPLQAGKLVDLRIDLDDTSSLRKLGHQLSLTKSLLAVQKIELV